MTTHHGQNTFFDSNTFHQCQNTWPRNTLLQILKFKYSNAIYVSQIDFFKVKILCFKCSNIRTQGRNTSSVKSSTSRSDTLLKVKVQIPPHLAASHNRNTTYPNDYTSYLHQIILYSSSSDLQLNEMFKSLTPLKPWRPESFVVWETTVSLLRVLPLCVYHQR